MSSHRSRVVIISNRLVKKIREFSPKVNLITRLEFELAYKDVAFEHSSRYAKGIPSSFSGDIQKIDA